MTLQQKRELYSFAETFLADGALAYSTAFSSSWKWPSNIEERLNQAQNEVMILSRELITRQDSVK